MFSTTMYIFYSLTVVFGKPIESNEYQDLNINELRELVLNKIITLKENRGNK